jgi:prepilin-type N-terminal cleavage/methylation domain-containing protein
MTRRPNGRDPQSTPTSVDVSENHRGSDGFTLIELMMAMTVTLILLLMVPVAIKGVTDASAYSQGTVTGSAQVRTAIENLQSRVESASQICLPTQMTTAGPTVTSGFAVRVLSGAFGKTQWDQWMLNTTTHVLSEQTWPTNWVVGNAVPQWIPIASAIVNSSTVPFSLPTVTTGSPQELAFNLQAKETYSNTSQSIALKGSISAFDTPYSSSPTVSCATAVTQEGWS